MIYKNKEFDRLPDLLSLGEIAIYLRVHYCTIRTLVIENKIPAFKIGHTW